MANLPSEKSILDSLKLATHPDTASYVSQVFTERLKKEKAGEKYPELINLINDYADFMKTAELDRENYWGGNGQPIHPKIVNYHQRLADIAAQEIGSENITFDYSISDSAEFLRGYQANGKEASDEQTNSLDILLNSWFVTNQKINKGGVIYQSDELGEIAHDNQSKPIRANPEELRSSIVDKSRGFKQHVEKKQPNLVVTLQEHPAPSKQMEEKPEQAQPQ